MKKIIIATVVSILSVASLQANAFGMKESIADQLNLNNEQRKILEDDMKERMKEMEQRRNELKVKLNLTEEQSEIFDKIFDRRNHRFKKFKDEKEKIKMSGKSEYRERNHELNKNEKFEDHDCEKHDMKKDHNHEDNYINKE